MISAFVRLSWGSLYSVYLKRILSISELAYWNNLFPELKIIRAISQSQRILSSYAFFIKPNFRLVNVTCKECKVVIRANERRFYERLLPGFFHIPLKKLQYILHTTLPTTTLQYYKNYTMRSKRLWLPHGVLKEKLKGTHYNYKLIRCKKGKRQLLYWKKSTIRCPVGGFS